jgi:putative phosphoribosyl transferase
MHYERIALQADNGSMECVLWTPDANIVGVILLATEIESAIAPCDYISSVLHGAHLGTLGVELPATLIKKRASIDVNALSRWLEAACDWLRHHPATADLPIGLFCTGKGAAAALQVAAMRGRDIATIVIRGGRPDLAPHGTLGKIHASTLLIAGGLDDMLIEMNRSVYAALHCKKRFEIIPGATYNFDEPGSPEVVARLARAWFLQHVSAAYL